MTLSLPKMFREKDKDDLKSEILSLKVQLNNAKNENCLLKVKIRKLQEEIVKKNKHIEVLLNPKKSSAFHKVMSENGATIVMNSLERNLQLQKQLDERNAQIKKLQGELDTTRLYTTKKKRPTSVKSSSAVEVAKVKVNMPVKNLTFKESKAQESSSLTASLEGRCAYNTNNEKDNENRCPRNSGSPESDLDRNELFCETPHKEIQQLHKYVIDVLSEVDSLKETIAQIQGERKRTEKVLGEKKSDDLQIKHHKGVKSNKPIQRNNDKEFNNKKTAAVIKSPRKKRVKKKSKRNSNSEEKNDALQIFSSCMDAIETQIQKESSCIDTESESDYNV